MTAVLQAMSERKSPVYLFTSLSTAQILSRLQTVESNRSWADRLFCMGDDVGYTWCGGRLTLFRRRSRQNPFDCRMTLRWHAYEGGNLLEATCCRGLGSHASMACLLVFHLVFFATLIGNNAEILPLFFFVLMEAFVIGGRYLASQSTEQVFLAWLGQNLEAVQVNNAHDVRTRACGAKKARSVPGGVFIRPRHETPGR